MRKGHRIALIGTGFIGSFYLFTLHEQQRGLDRIELVYARRPESAEAFAQEHGVPRWTSDLDAAVSDPDIDTVLVAVPNDVHHEVVIKAAAAGKNILCTKPLARTAAEAKEMLDAVEQAGVWAGYLEDLVYTPKSLKALTAVKNGALGRVLWVRGRETHPGPHAAWFWDKERAGGGAIVDMGCHCIEIARCFIGKDVRPVEVMCWTDTLVHKIDAEDHGIGLIRFANRSVGQFEVSWAFRGGMDLREEISGTEGTLWMDHFLRTGIEMFTAVGLGGYVAEKAEQETGWLFPVGDEAAELGYTPMFREMFDAMDEGREPMETFYDGYVVNAIVDACYRSAASKQWEPVLLEDWRGSDEADLAQVIEDYDAEHTIIKEETLPDGRRKLILRHKETGEITEQFI